MKGGFQRKVVFPAEGDCPVVCKPFSGEQVKPISRSLAAKLLFLFLWLGVVSSGKAQAPDPYEYFETNCVKCHTIGGGPKTGPDLKDVTKRRDRAWLLRWLQDPEKMLAEKDPIAMKLKEEMKGAVMPNFTDMTPSLAEALLKMLEEESKLEESRFLGLADVRPVTPEDIQAGREIFLGRRVLEGKGPACIGCHAVGGLGFFNAATFGPDLTKMFERRGGREGLSAWLTAVAHESIKPFYRDPGFSKDEAHFILSFLEYAAKNELEVRLAKRKLAFLVLALGAAVVVIGALRFWLKGRVPEGENHA